MLELSTILTLFALYFYLHSSASIHIKIMKPKLKDYYEIRDLSSKALKKARRKETVNN